MARRVLLLVLLGCTCLDTGAARAGAAARPEVAVPMPAAAGQESPPANTDPADASDGALQLADGRFCPLTHTDVNAELSGFVARVTLTQEFVNPTNDLVEAIYTFPLPREAAVDRMTLHIGDRVVRALIKRREEAKEIYARARDAGHTAALLEQERPNIFTQSVANIPPRAPVWVEISYVHVLAYDAGRFTFVFPMVVGPRYVPGMPTGSRAGGGWANDTRRVPDASRITPPVAGVHVGEKGSRAGHDIAVAVSIDAGRPIEAIESVTHQTDVEQPTPRTATVRLRKAREIPNRDFVLTFDTLDRGISDAVLAHKAPGDPAGHFAIVLQPPDRIAADDVARRDLVFVLDTSGSMSGFPIETAKAVVRRAIESLRFGDRFNLITFSGSTVVLFPEPAYPTATNVGEALAFLEGRRGSGGTEMMKAVHAALGPAESRDGDEGAGDADSIRIVCFMTDGYVGNDMAILGAIQARPHARVFSFGTGSAVNRFLLDGMARGGRGEAEYVLRHEDAQAAADRFYERINTPVLTDISIDWGTLPVESIVPARVPDLFAARPIVVLGQYRHAAEGVMTLRGRRAGIPFSRAIRVSLPDAERAHDAVAQLWAREQVEALTAQDWKGVQDGTISDHLHQGIERLGLEYRLVTPYTAFVAVEDRSVVEGGQRRTIQVPVEMPQNVSVEGVFGEQVRLGGKHAATAAGGVAYRAAPGGVAGGVVGGVVGGLPNAPPPPPPPPPPLAAPDQVVPRETVVPPPAASSSRLDVALAEIVQCHEKARAGGGDASACGADRDGQVRVRVLLAVTPGAGLLERLKDAGLRVTLPGARGRATEVEGTIPVHRLRVLAGMKEVRFVALQK